jgi:hypothetical protein
MQAFDFTHFLRRVSGKIGGRAMSEDAKEAFEFFVGAGWTDEQSAGLVANIEAESNFNFRTVGNGGTAFGLCQWHPDRQRNFHQLFHKDMRDSSFREQLQFVDFELRQGTQQSAGDLLSQAVTAKDAAEVVCSQYERPTDPYGHVGKYRGERAMEMLDLLK